MGLNSAYFSDLTPEDIQKIKEVLEMGIALENPENGYRMDTCFEGYEVTDRNTDRKYFEEDNFEDALKYFLF